MVQTRSASSSPIKKNAAKTNTSITGKHDLPPPGPPLRLLIAPSGLSEAARFISLENPSTNKPQSYLFCPEKGLFEVKRISRPSTELRSVLFASFETQHERQCDPNPTISNGYINKNAEYNTATPHDICFLLLPLACHCAKSGLFQSVEDMLDTSDANEKLKHVYNSSRALFESAMSKICDSVEAGDDSMFRYSKQKTFDTILAKARKACENGLPSSLEDKYVSRMLEAPVLSIRREDSSISLAESNKENMTLEPLAAEESFESKSSIDSAEPSVVFSEVSTVSTTITTAEATISPVIQDLQRLRVAFKFIVHSYCSPTFARTMEEELSSPSSKLDFKPLDSHISYLQKLRVEVAASQSLSNFTQKRRNFEDDEDDEIRAEKKRKIEEDERKKKFLQSRAVRELSKVDVKGMKKMNDFFTKKPTSTGKTKK